MFSKYDFQSTAKQIIAERVLADAKAALVDAAKGNSGKEYDHAMRQLEQAKANLKIAERSLA